MNYCKRRAYEYQSYKNTTFSILLIIKIQQPTQIGFKYSICCFIQVQTYPINKARMSKIFVCESVIVILQIAIILFNAIANSRFAIVLQTRNYASVFFFKKKTWFQMYALFFLFLMCIIFQPWLSCRMTFYESLGTLTSNSSYLSNILKCIA